jgi:hypothetical protein
VLLWAHQSWHPRAGTSIYERFLSVYSKETPSPEFTVGVLASGNDVLVSDSYSLLKTVWNSKRSSPAMYRLSASASDTKRCPRRRSM